MYELRKKEKIKIFLKYSFLGLLFSSFFLFGAKTSFAAYLTDAQCTSQKGTCNWVSNTCNYDEDSLGLCQGGPLSQGACCKKKSTVPTGYLTDAQCRAKEGTCNWVFNSCNADEESVGLCQGGPTSQGACCKKKNNTTPPNTGVGPTNPTIANPTVGASPTATSPTTVSPSGANENTGGLVPCKDKCTLCHLVLGFKNIYDYLLVLLLSATTLVVVVAGVMYMVSSGDKGMIDKAKSALTYALTAMILALTAWLIINATLSALGYTKVGSWYNFTCDTAQTQGPTGGTGTGTLPGNTNPATPGTPNGNCGGIKTVGESSGKCDTASPELSSLLKCINDKLGSGSGVYISNRGLNRGAGCHGGAGCSGTANAADLFGGSPTASANAAKECGTADTILINGKAYYGSGNSKVGSESDHFDHAHISVNNKQCGCDWGK